MVSNITTTAVCFPLSRVLPGPLLLACALTGLTGCGDPAADSGAATMVLPPGIGDWVKQDDPVTYDRETIFDYINGAGEVYRSYAFSRVLVERYQRDENEGVTVEVFDMGNAHDAYGVFSYAREEEEEGIGGGYERKGSVLCFWQDRYYVCVAAERRYDDPGPVLEEIAGGVSAGLPPAVDAPELVRALPSEGLVPFSDRYFHLHQTLNYNYYLARENVLALSADTDAVLARYAPGSTYLVLVRYPSDQDALAALASFREAVVPGRGDADTVPREAGRFVSTGLQGPFLAVILDAGSEAQAERLRQAALDQLARLPH